MRADVEAIADLALAEVDVGVELDRAEQRQGRLDVAEDLAEVEYFHLLFDRHEVVISNGAATESLYTGPEALKSVGPAARAEILALFPELATRDYTPPAGRTLASGRMARKLAVRHAQNGMPLVEARVG